MNKKTISILVVFLAVSILALFIVVNNKKDSVVQTVDTQSPVQLADQNSGKQASPIILFFGDGCPHCALVEKFVAENNIEAKVPFVKKEVYYNKQNANELTVKAELCGMPTDSIGVPFLWDGTKCLVGDQDIIKFFTLKANES